MRRNSLLLVLFAMLLACTVHASTTVSGGGREPWDSSGPQPTEVTTSMKCLIHEISENRTLVLIDEGDEQPHRIHLSSKVPLTAQVKKDFEGRKKLDFGDLEIGQRVKVTFTTDTGEIVRMKVLKKDS